MSATSWSTSSFSTNNSRRPWVSVAAFWADSAASMMLIFQPVRSDAKRTFCPPRPIAMAKFSSSTTTSMACFSSSTTIEDTLAGAKAPITNCAGSSLHKTISTRSPANSLVTAFTRVPRTPTQVPIGSTRLSWEMTAILAREPGSRAQDLISKRPCSISGTSCLNNSIMNSGAERDKMMGAPRKVLSTSMIMARTRSALRKFSLGIISVRRKRPSMRPLSTIRSPLSMRLTLPTKILSPRDRKSASNISRSASRIFCKITCLAAIAPMRPIGTDSMLSSMYSPSSISDKRSLASISISSASGFCKPASSGTTNQRRKVSYTPLSRSMETRISTSPEYSFLVAWASADSTAPNTRSRSTFFSREMASTNMSISRFMISYSSSLQAYGL